MSENNFKAYLRSRRWNDAQSKFVDHAQADPVLADVKSWEKLEDYLKGHGADEGMISEAEYIWGLYVANTRGQVG